MLLRIWNQALSYDLSFYQEITLVLCRAYCRIAEVKLPRDAVISERKIKEYLLTPRAEDDKSGFLALAGYSLQTWPELERDLRREAEEGDALLIRTTQYVRCIISKAN